MTPDLLKLIEEGKKVSAAATAKQFYVDKNHFDCIRRADGSAVVATNSEFSISLCPADSRFFTHAANTFDARTEIIETLARALEFIRDEWRPGEGTSVVVWQNADKALAAANEIAKRCGG